MISAELKIHSNQLVFLELARIPSCELLETLGEPLDLPSSTWIGSSSITSAMQRLMIRSTVLTW